MAIDLQNPYRELLAHVGHELECVTYGGDENVSIECFTCSTVLIDADQPEDEGETT